MTRSTDLQPPAAPSLARLAKTTAVALVVASVILVMFVLPAEYGIDPIGVGRSLGLTDIAAPPAPEAAAAAPEGSPMVPTQNGPIGEYPKAYQFDVFEFELGPYEYLEYKYQLENGATMVFAWTAAADVDHDFHGERAGGASAEGPAEQSFDKRARRQAAGSYTAPFGGIHGWYWENPGGEPIKIRLTSAGFYTSAVEIRSNRTRHPHVLRPADTLPAAPMAALGASGR